MEASELMIGDWVKYHNGYYKIKGIDGYTSTVYLEYNPNFWTDELHKSKGCVVIEDLEPISLTEEILKANGFEHEIIDDEDCLYFHTDGHTSVCQRFNDGYWGRGYSMRNNGIIIQGKDIPYVHELQHALRLCGLDELANNFKIE